MAKNDDWELCPCCGGTGTIEQDGEEEMCSICNGLGNIEK